MEWHIFFWVPRPVLDLPNFAILSGKQRNGSIFQSQNIMGNLPPLQFHKGGNRMA